MMIHEIKTSPALEAYKAKLTGMAGDPESAKNLAIVNAVWGFVL